MDVHFIFSLVKHSCSIHVEPPLKMDFEELDRKPALDHLAKLIFEELDLF